VLSKKRSTRLYHRQKDVKFKIKFTIHEIRSELIEEVKRPEIAVAARNGVLHMFDEAPRDLLAQNLSILPYFDTILLYKKKY
jgi:hypothetical protein